ncbi:MAG: hypothetical protein ACRDP5_10800 [Streptosporangiaceae bacterium]
MSGAAPDGLDDVRLHWGDAYLISGDGGVCTVRRRDGKGEPITAPRPDALRRKITADYYISPVPRDPQ